MEYTKETLYAFKKKQDNKLDKRADDAGAGGFGGFGVSEVCLIITNSKHVYGLYHIKYVRDFEYCNIVFPPKLHLAIIGY